MRSGLPNLGMRRRMTAAPLARLREPDAAGYGHNDGDDQATRELHDEDQYLPLGVTLTLTGNWVPGS